MVQSLTVEQVNKMMIFVSRNIVDKQEDLNQADRLIGDGDHGNSMALGFNAAQIVLTERTLETVAEIFKQIGNEFISSVGGCAGIIFGTFFRGGSKAIGDSAELNSKNFALFLDAALTAIIKRGGAQAGDKTMIDTLKPAAEIACQMKDFPLQTSLQRISEAALQGMESTESMLAKTGRSKTYGKKTLGHLDPGSITTYLIFKYMAEFVFNLDQTSF
jgi:dihydroxyacetone kinase-like protein